MKKHDKFSRGWFVAYLVIAVFFTFGVVAWTFDTIAYGNEPWWHLPEFALIAIWYWSWSWKEWSRR